VTSFSSNSSQIAAVEKPERTNCRRNGLLALSLGPSPCRPPCRSAGFLFLLSGVRDEFLIGGETAHSFGRVRPPAASRYHNSRNERLAFGRDIRKGLICTGTSTPHARPISGRNLPLVDGANWNLLRHLRGAPNDPRARVIIT